MRAILSCLCLSFDSASLMHSTCPSCCQHLTDSLVRLVLCCRPHCLVLLSTLFHSDSASFIYVPFCLAVYIYDELMFLSALFSQIPELCFTCRFTGQCMRCIQGNVQLKRIENETQSLHYQNFTRSNGTEMRNNTTQSGGKYKMTSNSLCRTHAHR